MQNQSKKIGLLVIVIILVIVIYLWLVNFFPTSNEYQIIEPSNKQVNDLDPQEIEDLKNKIDELDIDFEDILKELDIQ